MMKNIVLIGFMGSGKTTIGKVLEEKINLPFADTDKLIEIEEKCKISNIFSDKGEEYFRMLETAILKKLTATNGRVIISTGGGIVINPENIALLKQLGKVFYLRIKPETVIKRLEGDKTRPLLAGEDKLIKVNKLMETRKKLYEEAANIIIDVDFLSVEEIIKKILDNVEV